MPVRVIHEDKYIEFSAKKQQVKSSNKHFNEDNGKKETFLCALCVSPQRVSFSFWTFFVKFHYSSAMHKPLHNSLIICSNEANKYIVNEGTF